MGAGERSAASAGGGGNGPSQQGNPASLMQAQVWLMCFERAHLEKANGLRSGSIRYLATGPIQQITADGRDLFITKANLIVNSSGVGGVRSDTEREILKLTGSKQGADNEVTVSYVPGCRPEPIPADAAAKIDAVLAKSFSDAAQQVFKK